MRILYFLILLSTIVYSEIANRVIQLDACISMDYEWQSENSGDSDSKEENSEDHIEEYKLVNDTPILDAHEYCLEMVVPNLTTVLFNQSLKEILLPPPDMV